MIKSPFKFLDSFTLADKDIFFGRDKEISELYRRVFESKILLVYGISGIGKSSLVNCGLASRFDDSDWLPVNIRRGDNIIDSLNRALNRQAMTPLRESQSVFGKLQSIYLDYFKPVFLIFDQFEELFIFGTADEKTGFVKLLKEIVASEIQCHLIFVIREEFLAGITEFEYDLPDIFSNRFRVEKMNRVNAIRAIEGPCEISHIETEQQFAGNLIERICPAGNEIDLTFLQIYLDRIFRIAVAEKHDDDRLKFSNNILDKAGNVSDLLGQFLEEQIREMDDPDAAIYILKSFVSLQGTKKQMNEQKIQDFAGTFGTIISEPVLLKYLTRFVDLRILRERDENGHFELRHDALATKIFEKISLVEKEILEVRQFVENAYGIWQKRKVLITSADLDYIAPYESRLYLPPELKGFIERSKNELIRAKQRTRSIAFAGIAVLLIIFSAFTLWALRERNKAIAESRHSKVLLLIAKAKDQSDSDPAKAIRYAQLAYKYDSTNNLVNTTLTGILTAADSRPYYSVSFSNSDNISSAVFSPDGKSVLIASADNMARLWDLAGNCVAVFSGHTEYVNDAMFSPDGNYIITASNDATAKLWDLSGRCLSTLAGHNDYVFSAVFSSDSRRIITASNDGTAKLWNLAGICLQTLSGHSGYVSSAVFSPDSKTLLTASLDGTAKLWDQSGRCMVTFSGHTSYVSSALFSADGRFILTASNDRTARLWNLTGICLATMKEHTSPVYKAVFSPDGKYILTASNDGTAKLWDLSGNCLITFTGHTSPVYSVTFSPDGKSILTGSGDNTAKLWDPGGKCLTTLMGHRSSVYSALFSPDSKYVITASNDKTARLWDLSEKCLVTFTGHTDNVYTGVFSQDGQNILTASNDKTAKLWDLSGKCLTTFSGHTDFVNDAVFFSDKKSILTASNDKTAKLWDSSGRCLVTLSGHSDFVNSAVCSPDGKKILTSSNDNTVRLWDISGRCLATLSGHTDHVISAVFAESGESILTGSMDCTAKLWDLSGKCLTTFSGHKLFVSSAVFSADGRSILTASIDGTAKFWDLSGRCLVTLIGHSDCVYSALFSPDGDKIVTASDDQTAKLWDLSGNCLVTLFGHTSYVYSAVFSPDGQNILTASNDKTAKLWDLSGRCLVTLAGHTSYVYSAGFSPDGERILTKSPDRTARLWLTPSSLNSWLNKTKIGNLLPVDKAEIDELDDFETIQLSADPAFITEYARWYLSVYDTVKAAILFEKVHLLSPGFFNKKILGDIYKKQNNVIKYREFYANEPEAIIRDDIASLQDTSGNFDYAEKSRFYSVKAELYENLLAIQPSIPNRINASEVYDDLTWYNILSKDYKTALKAISRGIELVPSLPEHYSLLPFCLLLTGQFENARAVFMEYRYKPLLDSTYGETYIDDIAELEKAGITHPDLERVKELLTK